MYCCWFIARDILMCINVKRFIGQVWKETECQSFSPCGLGSATFLAHGCVHQPRSSLNPVCWGFLWRLHLLAMLFSHSVMSDSLRPHGLQHARLPCPSPAPGVCSNSCPLSWWCYPTISSSVAPFSSCLRCFPAWVSFPMSQFFTSGCQSIGAPASVLPMNI